MAEYAPIIVFAYNRAVHLEKTIKSLEAAQGAEKTDLYIWCDGSKSDADVAKVNDVRKYVYFYKTVSRFHVVNIHENSMNIGLADSIIEGVSTILENYDRVIVIEDDMIVSKDFIEYMNGALDFYQGNEEIFSVGGWAPDLTVLKDYDKDVFFSKRFECWGWAIWKERWSTIIWNYERYLKAGKSEKKALSVAGRDIVRMLNSYLKREIDSWAICVACHLIWIDKYTVVPSRSKIRNIGLDGSGTNCNVKMTYSAVSSAKVDFIPCYYDDMLNTRLWLYYSYGRDCEKLSLIDKMRYSLHRLKIL